MYWKIKPVPHKKFTISSYLSLTFAVITRNGFAMKKQTNKINWWIDAILFLGFILAFWLDQTGLSIHQWGGLFICVLALYHLLRHWKWVWNILQCFFKPKLGGQRIRFVLDFLLLCGLEFILLTGLLISTWLELPLENYLLVRDVHVISSIITLVILVVKIALHVNWITSTTNRIFQRKKPALVNDVKETLTPEQLERRQVLRLMGTVGAASFAAILVGGRNTFQSMTGEQQSPEANAVAEETSQPTEQATATPAPTETAAAQLEEPQVHTSQRRKRGQDISSTSAAATPTQTTTLQTTQIVPAATSTPAPADCIVRCPKGCAYPGSCRRYVDANFNNLCDLGECL